MNLVRMVLNMWWCWKKSMKWWNLPFMDKGNLKQNLDASRCVTNPMILLLQEWSMECMTCLSSILVMSRSHVDPWWNMCVMHGCNNFVIISRRLCQDWYIGGTWRSWNVLDGPEPCEVSDAIVDCARSTIKNLPDVICGGEDVASPAPYNTMSVDLSVYTGFMEGLSILTSVVKVS